MRRILPLLGPLSLALAGCATAIPVAVTYQGHSLSGAGQPTPDLSSFEFSVEDDRVACRGAYLLAASFTREFTFPISCSDGRTGRVEAARTITIDRKVQEGTMRFITMNTDIVSGKVIFSDGSVGLFNLGPGSRHINTKSLSYQDFVEDQAAAKSK